jgi:hypothetical protein
MIFRDGGSRKCSDCGEKITFSEMWKVRDLIKMSVQAKKIRKSLEKLRAEEME